jgi:hypothetical protein
LGLPNFTIVGLTDRAIQEARERVRASVRNAGFEFPSRRLTVNLAPAEVPKEGTGFDLGIATASSIRGRDTRGPSIDTRKMPYRGDRWTLGAALMVGAAALVVVVLALSETGRGSVAPPSPIATTSPLSPPTFPDYALYAVSCAGAGDCWAVGFSSSVNGPGEPLIEHYAGSRWAIVNSPNPSPG